MRMKHIIQGTYDYIKDCHHDSLIKKAKKMGCVLYDKAVKGKNNDMHIIAFTWKEGNLWHYIKQRQIGNEVKKQRRIADNVHSINK